jgi:hypothetical protein
MTGDPGLYGGLVYGRLTWKMYWWAIGPEGSYRRFSNQW